MTCFQSNHILFVQGKIAYLTYVFILQDLREMSLLKLYLQTIKICLLAIMFSTDSFSRFVAIWWNCPWFTKIWNKRAYHTVTILQTLFRLFVMICYWGVPGFATECPCGSGELSYASEHLTDVSLTLTALMNTYRQLSKELEWMSQFSYVYILAYQG